jgi:MFS family permease
VVKSSTSFYGGRFADVVGKRKTILLGWACYAVVYLLFGLIESPIGTAVVFLFYGVYFGLTEGVEKALVADLVPHESRGAAFGLFNLIIGIGALPASLLFGFVWKIWGMPAAFYMGAAFSGLASLLFTQFLIRKKYNAQL